MNKISDVQKKIKRRTEGRVLVRRRSGLLFYVKVVTERLSDEVTLE